MNKKLFILCAALILLGVGIWFRFRKPPSGFGAFKDYNVLLITIDTLRADHLPCYGYKSIQTPNIDRMGKESYVFENAFAHVPMTLPSHTSIMTGMLPMEHGVRDNAGFVLDPKITTLAEILKGKGYETAAFISAFVLDHRFGLNRGFNLYSDGFVLTEGQLDNTEVSRRAGATQTEVNAWLDRFKNKKFFLWIHYYDPHEPYDPPEPYRTEYKNAPYDGEIAYTDQVLGKLISDLEQFQIKDKTLIILTGDHGEGLGEHMERTHSLFIYNATLHVPLLIRLPGGKSGRIKGVVGHIDLAPSILEWLGFSPIPEMRGKSLIPMIQGKESPARFAYSESMFAQLHYGWSPLRSITTEKYKFIEAPTPELYDLRKDPGELKNLMKESPSIGNDLRNQLQQVERTSTVREIKPARTDPETEEKLRALGYIGSTEQSTPESSRIDPKDRINMLESIARAHKALDTANYQYVVESMSSVLSQDPKIVDAHFLLSTAFLNLGEKQKALNEMLKTIQLKPDHIQTLFNLGAFYQIQANADEAEHWYLLLLKAAPEHLSGTLNLINLYYQTNRADKAKPYVSRIINVYENALRTTASPDSRLGLLEKLAEIYFKVGQVDQSEKCLKEAIQLGPTRPMLHFHLGLIYQEKNELDKAASEYLAETKVDPKNYKAFFNLGVVYQAMNRFDVAADSFQEVLRITPGFQPAQERLAQIQDTQHKR